MRKVSSGCRSTFLLLATAIMAIPELGIAQIRPSPPVQGNAYVVLFEQANYQGNTTNYNRSVSNIGSNRLAGSITIGRGVWEVCDRPSFRGRCVTLDRSVPDLASHGLRNRVVSLRPSGSGVAPPTPPQGDWYIVLFDEPTYRGNPRNYKQAVSNLGRNMRVHSITIGRGVWEVCDAANYRGRCVTLDKNVPDLNAHGFNGVVRSIRPARQQAQPR